MPLRKTDLTVASLWLVYPMEDGGDVIRLTDWAQLDNVTPEDRRCVEKEGWREGFVLEASRMIKDGCYSVWVCGPEELAQCKTDASSGVMWIYPGG